MQLTVLTVLFSKIDALKGWSFEQVLFIYGFSMLPLGLFNLVSVNLYRFSESYIVEGNFDRVLLRPLNPLAQVMCSSSASRLNELSSHGVMSYAALARSELGAVDLLLLPCRGHRGAGLHGRLPRPHLHLLLDGGPHGARASGVQRDPFQPLSHDHLPPAGADVFDLRAALRLGGLLSGHLVIGSGEFRRFALFTPLVGVLTFALAYLVWSRGIRRYASTGS